MNYKFLDYINRPLAIDTDSITWNYNDKYSMIPQFLKEEVLKKMLNDRYGVRNACPKAKKFTMTKPLGSL